MSAPTPGQSATDRAADESSSRNFAHGFGDRGLPIPTGLHRQAGRFGRMFPQLKSRPNVGPSPSVLGIAGGPMDMGGTVEPTNPNIPAGFTFLGQFVDHDITFDPTSSLERSVDPAAVENFRTPAFELDSIYGCGPSVQPYMYDGHGRFLLANNGIDVPRNEENVAIIPDPRNDEHVIIVQLHLAFLRFHNAFMNEKGLSFEEAQREVRWHYQWLLVNRFLPAIVGRQTFENVFERDGRGWFRWSGLHPYTPIEFSAAAYRYGHSQVRPAYKVSDSLSANVFKMNDESRLATDLRGGRKIGPDDKIDWSNFFTGLGRKPDPSMMIDTRISSPLFRLPIELVRSKNELDRSLVFRNLIRGQLMGLPSGQDVANCMGVVPLDDSDLWGDVRGPDLTVEKDTPAPLWFYILREAEVRAQGGIHLGEVGGQIVAEVFHGFLSADSQSYISQHPKWKPTLDKGQGFEMADLLRFAGVT